ncbi:predicted protein [Arabidopsis lyrata subsp. lyrata]|uniref:Predicted protein n=1 Tax=Arabidopsis lyrata subsp. lyrata TaxID=81972 RepID=D7MM82_ARALL|nr:predicted protein [Arabidopsis lyrata subsp. lyrata]
MEDSGLIEVNCHRPQKIPKLDEDCEGSKSSSKQRVIKWGKGEDDEYLRQYLLFHYQFEKTQESLCLVNALSFEKFHDLWPAVRELIQ